VSSSSWITTIAITAMSITTTTAPTRMTQCMRPVWCLRDLKFIGTPLDSCHYPTMSELFYILVVLGAYFLRYGNELAERVSKLSEIVRLRD
jgi:hypothetical protein